MALHVRRASGTADRRFDWTRAKLESWAVAVAARHGYKVAFEPIGPVRRRGRRIHFGARVIRNPQAQLRRGLRAASGDARGRP